MKQITKTAAILLVAFLSVCGRNERGSVLAEDGVGRVSINRVVMENRSDGSRRVPFGTIYRSNSVFGDAFGFKNGYSSLGIFHPIHLEPGVDLFFIDGRAYLYYNSIDDQTGGNVGFGYRRYISGWNTMVGASGWFDIDGGHQKMVMQGGASVEAIINGLEFRANGYFAEGDGSKIVSTVVQNNSPFFQRNFIMLNRFNNVEQQFDGFDAEVGGQIPGTGVSVYGGGYWLENDATGRIGGWKLRAEAFLNDSAQIGIEHRRDSVFGGSTWATVTLQWPGESWRSFLDNFLKPRLPVQHLARQVERTYRIPVRSTRVKTTPVALVDPRDGMPIFVTHVSPGGAAGDGTFESPFNAANFTNAPHVDIIRVLPGSFTRPGTLALSTNQRLLAANHSHLFISTRGTFALPSQVVGSNPVITNLGGGDVIRLSTNNEVSGFTVSGGGTGIGIVGTGVSDFNLNRTNITGATHGIRLTNISQTGMAAPFGQANLIQDVTVTGSTVDGVNLMQLDGGTGTVLINQVSSGANGADGLILTSRSGSTLNATVQNSSFHGNAEVGVRTFVRDAGSSVSLTATGVGANNNLMDGLLFDIDSGGTFVANITSSSLLANSRNAIRTILAGGATGMMTATDVGATLSGQHGIFISSTGATASTSGFTFTRVDASNSGQTMMAGLRDAFNLDITTSTASVSIIDSTGINTAGNTTQLNGLRSIVDVGGTLTTMVTGSNFSSNLTSAINSVVRDSGTMSTLTVRDTTGNSSGVDGFFYDVTGGAFTASVTESSFNSSGRNAIRAIGGTSPAVMNVVFDSTTANSSVADGVFFDIIGGGSTSTFNFTYLTTSPSEIVGSGASGVMATFTGAGTTGVVNFNGITITGGISATTVGTTVTVLP